MVAEIVAEHYAAPGGFMVDAVLTVPHTSSEGLAAVLERLESVWKSLRSKTIWQELTEELGIVGCIRKLEVNLTKNGWHPHYHVSFLCDWEKSQAIKGCTRHAALADAHAFVAGRWSEAGKRAGIKISLYAQAAVALVAAVDGAKAVAYTMKNMGYVNDKKDSLTPMDLLRIIDQINDPSVVHAAKRLLNEYADVIKGKHTLTTLGSARNAKKKIATTKAEEPAQCEEPKRLGTVSIEGWWAVVKTGLREKIAEVTTREDLTAIILQAAHGAGFTHIPIGWLTFPSSENKTVIIVKSSPVSGGSTLEMHPLSV